jgi:peptide/nickel transport system substrate-binding protein
MESKIASKAPQVALPSSQSVSRRTLLKGTFAAGGLVFGTGVVAPSIAQTRRDVRIGLFGGSFGNLSPLIRGDIQGGILTRNLFDPLAEIDYRSRRVVPFVAESWKAVDPFTWQIKIREGMKWQKGYGEVTAEDLVYSWQFHMDTKSFQMGSALSSLASIKLIDKYVAEVKTAMPYAGFPGISMSYGGFFVPAKAHKEMGPQAYSAMPIGNGPFMLETIHGTEIVMVRNPDYWRAGLPKLDRLIYRALPDSITRVQAFLNNELDFISHPDPGAVKNIKKSSSVTYRSTPAWTWDYQQFNLAEHPEGAFQNKLVRQAISYAIDREVIANEIYYGDAIPTDNQIPDGYMGYRGSLVRYPKNGDLAKAKQLMAQAGVRSYEVEVITSDKDWLRKELELVAAMVSQIGITYKIQNMDMGGFNNLWLNRRYTQLLEDITLNGPDPDATSWNFLNSQTSRGYQDPKMQGLLIAARSEFDPAKREPLYHQIVDMTLDECPMIFHVNPNNIRMYKKGLLGFESSPQENVEKMDMVYWE